MKEAIVQIQGLNFCYQKEKPLFQDTRAVFYRGQITGIVGLSGCGKSTLLRLINGNLRIDKWPKASGKILIEGMNRDAWNPDELIQKMGTVYQDPDCQILFSHVEDEWVFGMENYQFSQEEMDARMAAVCDLLQIHHLRHRNPNELSGGEKQLVILASILCLEAEIFILDECMTQVDVEGRQLIFTALKRLKAAGKTLILVEHEEEHLQIADRVYRLQDQKLTEEREKGL
jgi:energy-coupling factor transporter ATP-binding protein EcfA2